MRLNHKIFIFIIAVLFCFKANAGVYVHPVGLKSGLSVWIDPDETLSDVWMIVYFKKPAVTDNSEFGIYSEIMWHSIQRQFEQLPGETAVLPLKWLPDDTYNWQENRFLTFRTNKISFTENMGKILDIFNLVNNGSFGKNLKLCQGNFYNQQDSLLWMSISPYGITKFCAAADSVKRSDLKVFYQNKEIYKGIQLYITGDFDQQHIIPYILGQADTTRKEEIVTTNLSTAGYVSQSLRMVYDPEYYLLSIQLPPVGKKTILGEYFLIDAVKKYFLNELAEEDINIYHPWSFGKRELTVVIKRDAVEPDFVDNFRDFLVQLNLVDVTRLKNWYYSDYLIHMREIYSDFGKNRRLFLMMHTYLNDTGYLFNIYTGEAFPVDEIQQAVRKILEINHLNADFLPKDGELPADQ